MASTRPRLWTLGTWVLIKEQCGWLGLGRALQSGTGATILVTDEGVIGAIPAL